MGRHRKTYTKEFKESAVNLYKNGDKTLHEISSDLGMHPENIRRWLKESEEGERKNIRVFPGHGNPRDEELFRLRKENADLRETNEILKKATAFFAAEKYR
jgi:transposase-like protein